MPADRVILVNPAAGGGRAARLVPWLLRRLGAGTALFVTARRGEAVELAARAAQEGAGRIIAVGGDGTVQEVLNGLIVAGAGASSLGIMPVGSGNDLARSLGLPRTRDAAWATAIGPDTAPLDVARALGRDGRARWFASAGGIGFDAQVAAAMADRSGWQRGRAGYLLTTLSELRRFSNRHVTLILDGVATQHDVLFVAIANGAFYGGGMRIAPDARADDGRLDVCVVGNVSRLTAIGQIPHLYRGTHVRHPAVTIRRAARIEIEGEPSTLVHLDGEPFGGLPLRVEIVPGALRVAAPTVAVE